MVIVIACISSQKSPLFRNIYKKIVPLSFVYILKLIKFFLKKNKKGRFNKSGYVIRSLVRKEETETVVNVNEERLIWNGIGAWL